MFITFPYFSLYVQALGGGKVEIGLVNSFYPLAALFMYPIAGYLADRYSRVKIISLSGYIFAAVALVFMMAPDWRFLALGNFLMGLTVFQFPAMNSLMADSLPVGRRGVGYSLWIAIPSAVGIVSPYLGGYLITMVGVEQAMRFLYGLTIITAVGIATMNLKFLREMRTERGVEASRRGLSRITLDAYQSMFDLLKLLPRSLRAFTLMLILSFFINNVTTPYWVVYSVEGIRLSELQWGTILLMATLVNVALTVPAGMTVDRFGVKRVLFLASALSIAPVILFPFSHSFAETAMSLVTINVANAFLVSAAPSFMAHSVTTDKRGRIMAALGQGMLLINTRGGTGGPGMGAVLTVPSILGSALGGFIYRYDPRLPWVLLALFMIVNAVICVVFLSPPEDDRNSHEPK